MFEKFVILVAGGLLGFTLSIVKDRLRERKNRKTEQFYLAIVVTARLENFISKCAEVVYDNGTCGYDECLTTKVNQPELSLLDLDVNWKSLDRELMHDLLVFPEKVRDAKDIVDQEVEYNSNPPDYDEVFEQRKLQYSYVGLQAYGLIKGLRVAAKLPEKVFYYEPTFNDAIKRVKASIEQREVIQAETNRKLRGSLGKADNPPYT
jgi:hypothetical protein